MVLMTASRTGEKILILALIAVILLIFGSILLGAYFEYLVPIKEKIFPTRNEPQSPACRQCLSNCSRQVFQRDMCRQLCYDNRICGDT